MIYLIVGIVLFALLLFALLLFTLVNYIEVKEESE